MRLFLTSSGAEGMAGELRALVGAGAGVGVSANALDIVVSDAERASWLERETTTLAEAGCVVDELDLRARYQAAPAS